MAQKIEMKANVLGMRHNPLLFAFLVIGSIVGLHCSPTTDTTGTSSVHATENTGLPILSTLPAFTLTNQSGQAYGLEDLQGKVWVAGFIFTRSTSTTPQQTARMSEVQQVWRDQPDWPGIRLVSISAEPEADTPDVLSAYAVEAGADTTSWQFLTGSRESIFLLCKDGFNLPVREEARETQRPITHSPKLALVDRDGRIRGFYDDFSNEGLQALVQDMDMLLPEMPAVAATGDHIVSAGQNVILPAENLALPWLETRRAQQLASATTYEVFHDFAFEDQRISSGITFRNKIVNNAGKDWMPNHYDHGNGVAVADVDGDGWYDLYFTTQVGSNELWRNRGDGTFENMTERAQVGLAERTSVSASFADIDNDGDSDLYVTTVKAGNVLFVNDGTGVFSDRSEASGLGYKGHSSSAVFFDYNKDGLLDLFLVNVGIYTNANFIPVTNGSSDEQEAGRYQFHQGEEDAFIAHLYPERAERSILFRNEGNARFLDVTDDIGLVDESWSGDASPLDVNEDGWPDLYVLNMQGNDEYYENVRGQQFVRKSRDLFPQTPWGAMGIKVFDYNNDGRQDIYITDMHSDMSENVEPEREKLKSRMQWPDSLLQTGNASIFGNAVFQKKDDGDFLDVSDQIGAENYWPWGLSVGDLNADGYDDVFVASSMNYPFRYGINSVLLNDRGTKFLDSEYVLGIEPRAKEQLFTPWFSLDCSDADKGHDECRGRTGTVHAWGSVGSRSSAIFDLDNDGDLDIVTNDFNSEPMVLISDLAERKASLNYIKVRLIGETSNRDGLGAVVKVWAGEKTYAKVHDGVSGYLSHSTFPLYFGLDEIDQVERVEVRWPSGTTQVIEGPISTNSQLDVVEAD